MSTTKFFILILVVLFSTIYCDGFSATFALEKVNSINMEHDVVIARDRERHQNVFLRSSIRDGIVNFSLKGFSGDYQTGFYFTKVKIGNPPKEYNLIIDTASDLTWVNCNPCIGCPRNSSLIPLSVFDPRSSSSAVSLSCSDRLCTTLPRSRLSSCSPTSLCSYDISYGDGSTAASGYYVSDTLHFDTVMGRTATTSADVVFGCTNNQSGSLTDRQIAVDGVFGLGLSYMSLVAQLDSQGIMPSVFSHCLNRYDNGGGGILVLGEVLEPNIIYTPLVPEQTSYHVNLLSISINGQTLPIDPKVFSISGDRQGTIVDSGTTYAFLPEEAYDSFIHALVAVVPPSVSSRPQEGCFQVSNSSVRDVFPPVSLNFAGGASMILNPEEYLLLNGTSVWCFGFQKSQGPTILGDLVLTDKIVVYDLALQRLGWANYDCSSSGNVSVAPPRVSSSSRDATLHQFLMGLLYVSVMSAGLLFV